MTAEGSDGKLVATGVSVEESVLSWSKQESTWGEAAVGKTIVAGFGRCLGMISALQGLTEADQRLPGTSTRRQAAHTPVLSLLLHLQRDTPAILRQSTLITLLRPTP